MWQSWELVTAQTQTHSRREKMEHAITCSHTYLTPKPPNLSPKWSTQSHARTHLRDRACSAAVVYSLSPITNGFWSEPHTCSGLELAIPSLGCKDQEYAMLSLRPACALVVYLLSLPRGMVQRGLFRKSQASRLPRDPPVKWPALLSLLLHSFGTWPVIYSRAMPAPELPCFHHYQSCCESFHRDLAPSSAVPIGRLCHLRRVWGHPFGRS